MQRTLVLNAGYEPLQLVSWQRAIVLLFSSKAEIVSEYQGGAIRTVSSSFTLPSVIRLKKYVRIVKKFGWANCTRKNVLIRDNYTCQYCGVRHKHSIITIDHVVPKSKGGLCTWDNLVAACQSCNHKKGNKFLKDTSLKLSRRPKRPAWSELINDNKKNMHPDWVTYLSYGR